MGSFLDSLGLPDTRTLQEALFKTYGPSDGRIKKAAKASFFRVDQSQMYTGADGKPLSHVCTMFAEVRGDGGLMITLRGNVPLDSPVQGWIESVGATCGAPAGVRREVSFSVKKGEQNKLGGLAKAMRATVARGRRYSEPSFKYTCPRTATALDHLQDVLDGVWGR
jgi:hypothetical protein